MRRRRRSQPTAIGELLGKWLERKGLNTEIVQYTIWVRWPELVGDRLAAHTEPGALRNGRLHVKVSTSSWLHELSFMKDELVRQINLGLGSEQVREVRLLAGLVRKRHRRGGEEVDAPRAAEAELPAPLQAEAEQAAAEVGDPALREVVRRAGLARLRGGRQGGA